MKLNSMGVSTQVLAVSFSTQEYWFIQGLAVYYIQGVRVRVRVIFNLGLGFVCSKRHKCATIVPF